MPLRHGAADIQVGEIVVRPPKSGDVKQRELCKNTKERNIVKKCDVCRPLGLPREI